MDSDKDIFEKISSNFSVLIGAASGLFLLENFALSMADKSIPGFSSRLYDIININNSVKGPQSQIYHNFSADQEGVTIVEEACVLYFYENRETLFDAKYISIREPYLSMRFTDRQVKMLCHYDFMSFIIFGIIEGKLVEWQSMRHH